MSGPGTCKRSLAIFGLVKPRRDSALSPSSCEIEAIVNYRFQVSVSIQAGHQTKSRGRIKAENENIVITYLVGDGERRGKTCLFFVAFVGKKNGKCPHASRLWPD